MAMKLRSRFPLIVTGLIAMGLGAAILLLWYVNIPVARRGGHELRSFWKIAMWLLVAGFGVAFGNRLATLLLAVPLGAVWLWWLVAAVSELHFVSAFAALAFGFIYLAPLALAVGGWHLLGWRTWRKAA